MKDIIITITHDESFPYKISEIVTKTLHPVFYVVANSLRRKTLENKTSMVVMTIKQIAQFISQIPNSSCIIIDSLWDINSDVIGPQLEQIILILLKKCHFIFNAKPFANIQTIAQWIFSITGVSPKVIEAPIERNAVAHFIFSEKPFQNQLIRNSSLFIDILSITDLLEKCTNYMPSNDAIFQEITDNINSNLLPILVVFPSNGYLRSFAAEHTEYLTLYDNLDLNEIYSQIEKFNSTKIMLTTTKIVDSIYIGAKSVILTSLFKYDGNKMRTMTPCEVHHIVRCAGRPGIDARGFFMTTLHPGLSKLDISSIFMSDLPAISTRFAISEEFYLTSLFSGVADFDNYLCTLLGYFTTTTRNPIIQDQLNQMKAQLPPEAISSKIVRLMALDTAICTLCTHPLNLRSLLVNGRAVKTRSMTGDHAWSICFGGTNCGLVTLAMRGVPSRGRVLDNDEKCLVTLPIHEIIAVSKSITPLSRQQLSQIDDNENLVQKDYSYYDGNLAIGGDRYLNLLKEMQEVKSSLDNNLLQCWRQIAEVCIRNKMLKQKLKQVDQQKFKQTDLNRIRELSIHAGLLPSCDGAAQKAFIARSSGVSCCFSLSAAIEAKFYEQLSDEECAAFLMCLGDELSSSSDVTGFVPESITQYLASSGRDDSSFAEFLWLLDGSERELNIFDCLEFERACIMKKARKTAGALLKAANQLGIQSFSQKMSNVINVIKRSFIYCRFFE